MPTVRLSVPMYLPMWLHGAVRSVKRALFPAPPVRPNIDGERHVEWSFISAEMPEGPGQALEFGCEHGYLSLMAARKRFHVVAVDLEPQSFVWRHPEVEFRQGDLLGLTLRENSFDLIINCSSVEHVGVAGRYGISVSDNDGDIHVMQRLAQLLRPTGVLLMTAPCGRDAVMAPWCRVYGRERLPRLLAPFRIETETYWIKDAENRWVVSDRATALNFKPLYDPSNGYACAYALGGFALRKAGAIAGNGSGQSV